MASAEFRCSAVQIVPPNGLMLTGSVTCVVPSELPGIALTDGVLCLLEDTILSFLMIRLTSPAVFLALSSSLSLLAISLREIRGYVNVAPLFCVTELGSHQPAGGRQLHVRALSQHQQPGSALNGLSDMEAL